MLFLVNGFKPRRLQSEQLLLSTADAIFMIVVVVVRPVAILFQSIRNSVVYYCCNSRWQTSWMYILLMYSSDELIRFDLVRYKKRLRSKCNLQFVNTMREREKEKKKKTTKKKLYLHNVWIFLWFLPSNVKQNYRPFDISLKDKRNLLYIGNGSVCMFASYVSHMWTSRSMIEVKKCVGNTKNIPHTQLKPCSRISMTSFQYWRVFSDFAKQNKKRRFIAS